MFPPIAECAYVFLKYYPRIILAYKFYIISNINICHNFNVIFMGFKYLFAFPDVFGKYNTKLTGMEIWDESINFGGINT